MEVDITKLTKESLSDSDLSHKDIERSKEYVCSRASILDVQPAA
jgi:hypothetical protein